jgi:UDP-N-acetylglucosamine--N-acetylmuramyl-(pentapeptide) pyrophosphoryl-undecaprenol N-acetylglucosamine transferase
MSVGAAGAEAAAQGPRILLAAGGTGGHIWPAVAVARELERRRPPWHCRFVAGDRPVEAEVYRAAGLTPDVIRVPPPRRARWRTWAAMGPALSRARRLIRHERPDVILGTGGYVAAPVAVAAWMARRPTVLLEPNALPGRVTRLLAPHVAAVALADPAAEARLRAKRVVVTGNPLSWTPNDLDRARARERWGIAAEVVCLLVLGGSQGARSLNDTVRWVAERWREDPPPRPVHLIWMAGSANLEEICGRVSTLDIRPSNLDLHGHLWPLTDALAAADLVVSRAGAGAVADLAAAGKPSVLIPLPTALDDHQRANAQRLVDVGAAVLFDERSQTPLDLFALLRELIADERRRSNMAAAAATRAMPDAAARVADLLTQLVEA